MSAPKNTPTPFILQWIIIGLFICLLIAYQIICHFFAAEIQVNMDEGQRIFIRSLFYIVAIILFPFATLLRHVLLRLNQTMPGDSSATTRYFTTILVTLMTVEIVGVFGLIMFILGDSYNTLYIFTTLAALGLFLHRPKESDYEQIVDALAQQQE
jgi:hypothetical protein